ncbi:MAG: OB-fold nucleic acid binding domain-containing protein [Candidatus Undinarchaeales archaeon]
MTDKSKFKTAVKVSAKDLVNGEYKEEGKTSFVKTKRGNISKVRLLGTIVDKFISEEKNYGFAILDDSSETIRLTFFKEDLSKLKKIKIGDIIDSIGYIGMYRKELYVNPKIIKKINNPNWELLRNLELKGIEKSKSEDDVDISDLVMKKIKKMDSGSGASLEKLLKELNTYEDKKVIDSVRKLMFKGELFEPKKGVIKPVE